MIEFMGELDRTLFLFLNVKLASPVTDFIMPIITNDWYLRFFYVLTMGLILWKGDVRLRWLVLFSVIVLAISNTISAEWLKPLVERERPCHVMEGINLLVGCGGGKSMPSAHAANAFGLAILFGFFYRTARWPLVGLAVLVALSRVFVGVHYPFDVTVGAVIGVLAGLMGVWMYRWFAVRYVERK